MKKNKCTIRNITRSLEIPLFISLSAAKAEEEAVQEKGILRKTVMPKVQGCILFLTSKKPIHLVTTRTCRFGDWDKTAASSMAL